MTCPDKAKCRGAGTEAITDLVGFHDPNTIPIAAFYHGEPTVNRFVHLSNLVYLTYDRYYLDLAGSLTDVNTYIHIPM